jgi:hypothetical protein
MRNNPEERTSQLLRGGSLKSQKKEDSFLQNGTIIKGSFEMSLLKNAAL